MRLATTGNENSELKDYHCNEKCTRLVYASLVADERNKGNHSSSTSPLVEKTLIKMDTLCTLRVNTQLSKKRNLDRVEAQEVACTPFLARDVYPMKPGRAVYSLIKKGCY